MQPGSTSGCAADVETTGLDKPAVDSHVQTRLMGRSSLRGARSNRGSSVNDRVGSMKNLEHYLPQRPRRKAPIKVSESPILSPDTMDALQKAETLVKEAQKTILEASYDIASSPEREQSIRSNVRKEAEDESAIYIRDIVATRFYEANESGRIFTRPSTRPLTERVYRPVIRQKRARRARETSSKICSEESTTSRPRYTPSTNVQKNLRINSEEFHRELKKPSLPHHTIPDEETPTLINKDTDKFPSPWKIDNRNVANSFRVQQGPRVDIRNELTITNVEKVDIFPQPRSSLPVQQNNKIYEFRHETRVKDTVDGTKNVNEEARTIQSDIGNAVAAGDSPKSPEKSRDAIEKSQGSVAASERQGSWSDLVGNKSGQSIPLERLEGHADNVRTRIPNRSEHVLREIEENNDNKENKKNIENKDNRGDCFMDFLRRFKNSENFDKDENFKHKFLGSLDTNDKINIFDRAVEQFLGEFKYEERDQAQTNVSASLTRSQVNCLPEKKANEDLVEDAANEADIFIEKEFDGNEYFEEEWNPEEIYLQPPNIVHLEKTLKMFDSTMDKVLRGTRSLAVLMSEYSIETENDTRPAMINQDHSHNPKNYYLVATKDISNDMKFKNIQLLRKKASDNCEDCTVKDTIKNSNEILTASRYYTETNRDIGKKLPMERESSKRFDRPRYSTPLNDLKITRHCRLNADCESNEFTRFLDGIRRPSGIYASKEEPSSENADFPIIDNQREDKIVLSRNKFLPTVSTVTKNYHELQKKIVLDEINKKCNFDFLFDKDRLIRAENEEKTHESQTFSNHPIRGSEKGVCTEVQNSGTRSLIQDSAIGRTTDQSERISVGTKLIDEYSTKKDSSRSERCAPFGKDSTKSMQSTTKKNGQTSEIESLTNKNIESMRTNTLTMENNSVETAETINKSEKKWSTALQPDPVDVAKTSDNENEYSVKYEQSVSNKNRLVKSPESSLKDRTSFEISTAYSEEFQEPAASADKSGFQEKSDSPESAELELISNHVEIAESKEQIKDDGKTVLTPSIHSTVIEELHNESKREIQYLDKSVSISLSKLSDKIEDDKKGYSSESRLIDPVTEEKGTVECNSEIKEADKILPVMSEKPGGNERNAASTSAFTKASGTSSIAGVLRREENKLPKELNDDEVPGHFELKKNLIGSSCDACQGDLSNCEQCTKYIVDEVNDAFEKLSSISTIETVIDDSPKSDEEGELRTSEEVIKTLESNDRDEKCRNTDERCCVKRFPTEKQKYLTKITKRYSDRKHNRKLCQSEDKIKNKRKNVSRDSEAQRESEQLEHREFSKTSGIDSDKDINKIHKNLDEIIFSARQMNLSSSIKLGEFANFESSVTFHSTPKQLYPSESSEPHFTENAKNLSKLFSHNSDKSDNKKWHRSKDDEENENKVTKNPIIDSTDKEMNKTFQALASDLKEITNFPSSTTIDLTPKRLIENSRCAREEFFSPIPDPIPDDDHANVATDTCSENYSEGELYLPSSCSYSLGEIRISERGSYGTVDTVIQTSDRNPDGMKIYFSKKVFTRNSPDNTMKDSKSPVQSPGEVQETDVESICSSQVVSSDGENRMDKRYTLQLKPIDM